MYKQKNNKTNKNNGITLIALVLTIIVLLILAGVVLSLALGQNGLVFKARETKKEQEIAQEKDRIMTAYGATFVHKNGKYDESIFKENLIKEGIFSIDDDKLNTITESPLKIELVRKHTGYTVIYSIEDGIVNHKQVGDDTTTNNTIPKDLQVGDTVIYDPTKGVTDTSKLTYTSVKGTAKTGGNGYDTQTVTAKSNNNEWIVISNANNQIKVMSKEPIGDVNGGDNKIFTLKGGIGWLYAEEELHKACSIYGYGKGAKQTNTTYQIGNKYTEEVQTRTLTNSGARSMSMEDIVKIMKGDQYTDFTEDEKKGFHFKYMNPMFKSGERLYPTISSDNEEGVSTITRTFDNHYYSISNDNRGYDKELIMDEKVNKNKVKLKKHIYKNQEYYLSSKCFTCGGFFGADIYTINDEGINTRRTLFSNRHSLGNYVTMYSSGKLLRPVVYLDLNMVEKQSTGVWKIKD